MITPIQHTKAEPLMVYSNITPSEESREEIDVTFKETSEMRKKERKERSKEFEEELKGLAEKLKDLKRVEKEPSQDLTHIASLKSCR